MVKEKWNQYSLNEQLGNILSEICRAHNREKIHEFESRNKSLKRALELIDLTLCDQKHACSLKEIKTLRNIIAGKYIGSNDFDITYEEIQNHLLPFAVLDRR